MPSYIYVLRSLLLLQQQLGPDRAADYLLFSRETIGGSVSRWTAPRKKYLREGTAWTKIPRGKGSAVGLVQVHKDLEHHDKVTPSMYVRTTAQIRTISRSIPRGAASYFEKPLPTKRWPLRRARVDDQSLDATCVHRNSRTPHRPL